jgi:hypothetical protein
MLLTDTAGDQLCVLRTEVENQNGLALCCRYLDLRGWSNRTVPLRAKNKKGPAQTGETGYYRCPQWDSLVPQPEIDGP